MTLWQPREAQMVSDEWSDKLRSSCSLKQRDSSHLPEVLDMIIRIFARRVAVAASIATFCVPSVADAQTVPVRTLARPDVELSESFTVISSIRELSDGRVIVADNREKQLHLADLKRQQVSPIGREGGGPAEFGSIGRLYALGGDVTLLYDFVNNRFLVIGPDGKPTGTRPIDYGPYSENEGLLAFDAAGRIFLSVRPKGSREEGGVQAIVRYDPQRKKADTITSVTLPTGIRTGASDIGNGLLKMFTNMPFAAQDVVAVGLDGSVGVVRASDYHVEWFGANNRKVAGSATPFEAVRITAAEKRAFLEQQIRPGAINVRAQPGAKAAPIARGSGAVPGSAMTPEALDDRGMEWPARKPPFLAGAARIDRTGRLWVQRTSTHDDKQVRFDVFDANGKLTMKVVLPPKTALAGFGNGTVYLSRADDDELRYLQRYTLP